MSSLNEALEAPLRSDPNPREAASGLYDKKKGDRSSPTGGLVAPGAAFGASAESLRRYVGTIVTLKPKYAFVRPATDSSEASPGEASGALGGDADDIFLHATDMRPGEDWVEQIGRASCRERV